MNKEVISLSINNIQLPRAYGIPVWDKKSHCYDYIIIFKGDKRINSLLSSKWYSDSLRNLSNTYSRSVQDFLGASIKLSKDIRNIVIPSQGYTPLNCSQSLTEALRDIEESVDSNKGIDMLNNYESLGQRDLFD